MHSAEFLLFEYVPSGHMVQPHNSVDETPIFGLDIYLYPGGQGVHTFVFE
jgi:hypothetical protein